MNSTHFITQDDFILKKVENGGTELCISIPGLTLILFYSPLCKFCQEFLPVYKTLPGSVQGCQFAILNVSQNKNCIKLSENTKNPIDVVPYLLLYVNGRPFIRYKGELTADYLRYFIIEVIKSLHMQQNFLKNNQNVKLQKNKLPHYTIGKPLKGFSEIKYLHFNMAYKDRQRQQQQNQQQNNKQNFFNTNQDMQRENFQQPLYNGAPQHAQNNNSNNNYIPHAPQQLSPQLQQFQQMQMQNIQPQQQLLPAGFNQHFQPSQQQIPIQQTRQQYQPVQHPAQTNYQPVAYQHPTQAKNTGKNSHYKSQKNQYNTSYFSGFKN